MPSTCRGTFLRQFDPRGVLEHVPGHDKAPKCSLRRAPRDRHKKRPVRNIRAFFVPATGVISNFFLEDLERIWALRDVIPNPPDSKILDNHFEKWGENPIFAEKSMEKKMKAIEKLITLIEQYKKLGIDSQIDYEKFYLYSIITHSTAIEGSTVTEIENQLLFDEGISAKESPFQNR